VHRRPLVSLLLTLVILFVSAPALAQYTRDNAANKKIDEAINQHYLATDFDKAEAVLQGTVQACGEKCSPAVIAKAWMYVGVVRGSGKQDLKGAKEAFLNAVTADPKVQLDTALATPEVQQAFTEAGGGTPAPPEDAAPPEEKPAAPPPAEEPTGKPGKAAVAPQAECPPEFPGCPGGPACGEKEWGASCSAHSECQCGLLCTDGSCETAPSCEEDADCGAGLSCVTGRCYGTGETEFKRHWFGLHVAQDFGAVSGTDVCVGARQDQGEFVCFRRGSDERYQGEPFPGSNIGGGLALATTRFLLSYDFAFHRQFTAGARAGFAIRGSPDKDTPFLPLHVEARLTFWILDLTQKGFRPYVSLGGGLAQVDTKVEMEALECNDFRDNPSEPPMDLAVRDPGGVLVPDPLNPANPTEEALVTRWRQEDQSRCIGVDPGSGAPIAASRAHKEELQRRAATPGSGAEQPLDVYRKMGQGFVAVGVGTVFAFTPTFGLQLNVNTMFMLPTSGFVLEPSLGAVVGF
jgi:hypothetical protein